jgi:hypothetical protein
MAFRQRNNDFWDLPAKFLQFWKVDLFFPADFFCQRNFSNAICRGRI